MRTNHKGRAYAIANNLRPLLAPNGKIELCYNISVLDPGEAQKMAAEIEKYSK